MFLTPYFSLFHLYFFTCLRLSGASVFSGGFIWTSDAFATPAAPTEASAAAAEGGAAATSAPAANAGAGGWLMGPSECMSVCVSEIESVVDDK